MILDGFLVVVLEFDRVGLIGRLSAATYVDGAVLPGHGIGMIALADDGAGVVIRLHLVRRGIGDDNHLLAGVAARTPDPVVLVTADGGGESVGLTQDIDGAGFAVISSEDAGDGALLLRQGVIDCGYLPDEIMPAETVSVELRERGGVVVF